MFNQIAQDIRQLRDSIEMREGVAKSEATRLLDKALNTVLAAKERRVLEALEAVDWTKTECVWGTCRRCSKCNGC